MKKNPFEYHIKKNDDSIASVRSFESFYRYDESNPREFSDDYISFGDEILHDERILSNCSPIKEGFRITYINNSKKIWRDLGIHLTSVYYLDPKYKPDAEFLILNDELYDNIRWAYPTNVPKIFTDDSSRVGPVSIPAPGIEGNYTIFQRLILPKYEKKLTSAIFAHEVTHMELLSTEGILTSLIDSETFPIFCELLFSSILTDDGSLLELTRNIRFIEMASVIVFMIKDKNKMDFETRIKNETYLVSGIQALNLFNKYANGSDKVKKEIIKSIEAMFCAEKSVNEILLQFDSKFDDIKPNLEEFRKVKKI